jgi:hypothetical protein
LASAFSGDTALDIREILKVGQYWPFAALEKVEEGVTFEIALLARRDRLRALEFVSYEDQSRL